MTYAIQKFSTESKTWSEPRGQWYMLDDAKVVVSELKDHEVRDYSTPSSLDDDGHFQAPMFSKGVWRVCVVSTSSWQHYGRQHLERDGRIELLAKDYLVESFKYADCFWHKSTECYLPHSMGDNKVGYFETMEAAMLNKAKVLTIGKFIKRHFTLTAKHPVHYLAFDDKGNETAPTEKELRDFHNLLLDACAQLFADSVGAVDWQHITNSKEIARAYMEGPNSCMAHPTGSYETEGIHPTEVYGDKSDISLLVVRRGGKVTGRTLVWKAKCLYSTVYGDSARIRLALDELFCGKNYRKDCFHGALLNKHSLDDDVFVMAYVDGSANYVDHDGDMFKLVEHGEFACDQYETGVIGDYYPICCDCGGICPDGEGINFEYSLYCDECISNVAFFNERSYEYAPIENLIDVYVDSSPYPEQWDLYVQEGEFFYCDNTDRHYCSETNGMVCMFNGETWLDEAFSDEGFTSKYDGENYHIDEAIHCPAFDGLITVDQNNSLGFMELPLVA